jgi:glucose/arabinose dehydrogenase
VRLNWWLAAIVGLLWLVGGGYPGGGSSPAAGAVLAQAVACASRPPVGVAVAPAAGGQLQAIVTANTSAAVPGNRLRALYFGAATNALIDVPGGSSGQTGSFTHTPPPGTSQVVFYVRQVAPSASTTVPLTVVDECGDWPTLVGGGVSAFPTPTAATPPPSTPTPTRTPTRTPTLTPTRMPTATPSVGPISNFGIRLDVVLSGFVHPVQVTHAGNGSGDRYVVERRGVIQRLTGNPLTASLFLDITSLVRSVGGEQGLLGLAFHPAYASNGYLYVNYTDLGGNTVIARYTASADRTRAEPLSASVILQVAQPFENHNGGLLQFGPDGYLYIGMGDGGSSGDPQGNGQNPGALLGKMLRIDVNGAPPYAIPPGNPFFGRPGYRGEIWALGLRNPWRWSFDRATGDLYIADVGQSQWEEVNRQPASSRGGENYGWVIMEGRHCYPATVSSCNQTGITLPIAEYSHSLGCSVTGGYVYRGTAQPPMRGLYIFGDFCSGRIWSLEPQSNGAWTLTERLDSAFNISSFGEDEAGELYLTSFSDGTLYRVVAVPR